MLSFVTIAIMLSKSTLHAIGQLVSLFRGQGSKQGQLSNPTGVAVNGEGHLFIAEHYYHKISVFTEDGQFLRCFGSRGNGAGHFEFPGSSVYHQMD